MSKADSEVVVRIGISGGEGEAEGKEGGEGEGGKGEGRGGGEGGRGGRGEFTVLPLTLLTLSRKEFNNSSGVPDCA